MELFLNIVFLVIGLLLLIKGADLFVGGASSLAKNLKIPTIVIGLTIVSLGTSLPELAVSFIGAVRGNVDLSVSNIVGSNIFNLLAVLGASAIIAPVMIGKKLLKFELPILIGVTLFLLVISFTSSTTITWYFGLFFLILTIIYIFILVKRSKNDESEESIIPPMKLKKTIIFIIIGCVAIIFGGECVNSTSQVIASACGMNETLIGLTIVAIGTSLPELVTSIVASKKRENDIALGNVIGSNTLNITFILGLCSTICPLPISNELRFDIMVSFLMTVIVGIIFILTYKKKGLTRKYGIMMILIYIIYVSYIVYRNYCF